jgi:methyltransferase family protein
MLASRRLEGEWLDELPAEDPRARRSRADLRRINLLMGNAGIVAGELRRALPGGVRSVAELGAGDGSFTARVAKRMGGSDVQATLVDRQDIVSPETHAELARHGWSARVERGDVFAWLERDAACDAVIANLFLHHFEDAELARMLSLAARRARVFVACETRRSSFALAGARMLGAIGCNDVSRHDAVVSIRAGFRDGELSSLWPSGEGWSLREEARGLFSHSFVATRRLP